MRTEQALEEKTRSNPLRDESWQVLTIPKHYYTDPSILERENEKIFSRSWQYAGHACHLPEIGSYFTVEFLNDSFLFVRDTERTIRGFYNVCQHRAHRLVNGQGCKKILTCPYHAWSYGLDGKLRSARGTDRGAGKFDIASYGLEPVRVEMLNDIIMFNMDPAAPSFESLVPGVAEELRQEIPRLSEFTMDKQPEGFGGSILDCNWKVLVDNCTECYHCVPSHPAFVDLIDMNTYQIKLHQIHAKHSAKIRRTDSEKAYSLTLTEGAEDFLVWHIWPNITLAKLPGTTGLGVFVVDPLGVTQCRSRGHFFRLPTPETTEEAARREYVAKVLFPEDERICESVQLGLGSRGYRRGPFVAPDACDGGSEATVRLFQRLNLEALGEVA